MAAPGSAAEFLTEAARLLTRRGWRTVEETPEPFGLILEKKKSTLVVHTHTALFFIDGDNLSRDDIREAMAQAHAMTAEAATAPLFPATVVVVFVYTETMPPGTRSAKKRDIARGHATVAWTVSIPDGQLETHRGTPLVRDGKRALEQALHASANDG
ncbi:MAG: hypothetical protein R6U10_02490 [Thermoplasmatota archaeon]